MASIDPADPIRLEIASGTDVVTVRQRARDMGRKAGMSLLDVTKLVTAASELGRNALEHGGGGWAILETVRERSKVGVRMTFQDDGPGIPDLDLALTDGYTTGGGLGLGLSGSRRLVNEFAIESAPGKGTKVIVTRWK